MPLPLIPALIGGLRTAAGTIGKKGAAVASSLGKNSKSLKTSSYGMGVLSESVLKLNNSFKSFLKINERLAVVNSNFKKEYSRNSAALHGAEQGFGLAAKAMTEFRVLGFKNTNKGMIDLATRMKITGQNSTKMMKTFQDLHGKGGVSEQGLGKLGKSITQSSLKYNTTTDSLIGAIGKLSENLLTLNFAGGTEATADFTKQLAAMVGPAQAGMAGEIANLLVSTNQQDIDRLALMNLEQFGEDLFKGQKKSDFEIRQAIDKMADFSRQQLGGEGQVDKRSSSALLPLVGKLGMLGTALSKGIETQQNSGAASVGVMDSLKETYEHLKAKFMVPFQLAMADMAPSFKRFSKGMMMLGGSILNFVTSFSPVFIWVMDRLTDAMLFFAGVFQKSAEGWSKIFGGGNPEDKKVKANQDSFHTILQTALGTFSEGIKNSNTIASKSFAITSQNYISSQHRSNTLLSNMDGSITRMTQLRESANAEQVRQNLIDINTSNSDIDNRLLAIADYSARETEASHAYWLKMLYDGQQAGNGIQKDILNKPDPVQAASYNAPGDD